MSIIDIIQIEIAFVAVWIILGYIALFFNKED